MKKITKKFMGVFLFCTCLLFIGTTQQANAYVDNSYNWSFGIAAVLDGTTKAQLSSQVVDNKSYYVLQGNSVAILDVYAANTYPGYCYVRVDGNYVGRSTDSGLDFYDSTSGTAHFNGFIIKNLTPGKHTIEARADRPWDLGFNYGPAQKIDTINVIVPNTTTSSTAKLK